MKGIYDLNSDQKIAISRFFGGVTNTPTLTFTEMESNRVVYDLIVRQPIYSQFLLRRQAKEFTSESKDSQLSERDEVRLDIFGFVEFTWESLGPLFRNLKDSLSSPLLVQIAFLVFIEVLSSQNRSGDRIESKNEKNLKENEIVPTPVLLREFRVLIANLLQHIGIQFAAFEKRANSKAKNYMSQISHLSSELQETSSLNAHFKELVDISQAECEALRQEIQASKTDRENIMQSKLFKVQELKLNETMIHDIVKENYSIGAENSQLRLNCRQLASENQRLSRELAMYQSQALMLSHYLRTKERLEGQLELNEHQFMIAQDKLRMNEEHVAALQKMLNQPSDIYQIASVREGRDAQLIVCLVEELETCLRIIHDAGVLIVDSELQIRPAQFGHL